MVRPRRQSLRLLAVGLLLTLAGAGLPPSARSQDRPAAPPETEPAKPDASNRAAKRRDPAEEGPAPPARGGEKAGTVPVPAPSRGEEGGEEAGAASAARDEAIAQRVLEIEDAIWREIESVESRLAGIKARLGALRGPGVGLPWLDERLPREPVSEPFAGSSPKPSPPVDAWGKAERHADLDVIVLPGDDVFLSTTADERLYLELLRRQDDVLRRWRRVAPPPEGRAARRAIPASREKERDALREELRGILAEILDQREKAREKQIEGLRREIDDIERAIDSRREGAERFRLIEGRLEDLLGP